MTFFPFIYYALLPGSLGYLIVWYADARSRQRRLGRSWLRSRIGAIVFVRHESAKTGSASLRPSPLVFAISRRPSCGGKATWSRVHGAARLLRHTQLTSHATYLTKYSAIDMWRDCCNVPFGERIGIPMP